MSRVNREHEVAALLQRLNATLNGREARQSLALLQRSGLSLPHVVSLYVLRGKGPQSMSELASALHLSLAATSQLVDRLVENGFVERAEAKGDRRFKTVQLKPKGRRTLESLHQVRERELSVAVGRLPEEIQEDLARVLATTLAYLEAL